MAFKFALYSMCDDKTDITNSHVYNLINCDIQFNSLKALSKWGVFTVTMAVFCQGRAHFALLNI